MVSSACFGIDAWCAAEFAPDDDGDIVEHAAFFEVGNECMESVIEDGQEVAHAGEVIAVGIEVADGDADAANAGFDEAAGEEEFADGVWPFAGGGLSSGAGVGSGVALEDAGIFGFQIECLCEVAGEENTDGLSAELIHGVHHAGAIGITAESIEVVEEVLAIIDAARGELGVEGEADAVF